MTPEEILEGNKIIAEFMDLKTDKDYYTFPFLKSDLRTGLVNKHSELHFDSSWNWLMPVVEMIWSMGYWGELYCGENGQKGAFTTHNSSDNDIECMDDTLIQATYKMVIEVIIKINNKSWH